jgi:crotonobetainyl-CoA:carnitine CoA-transferase CaiB-like acyl-CoA transferase
MRPLDNLTILDLSRVLACPFASMILAELGATVIKIEQPGTGDETRGFEPQVGPESAYYFACNRSKQSVTVNLKKPQGQQIVRDLCRQVEVVIENFPVDTLKRYNLDYATLKPLHPSLIYVSCTGFGLTGPYASRKGYDTVFQAMGGFMSLTGDRGGNPVKAGLPIADLTSGLWVAIAVLSALNGRNATGQGCHIDFSMLDGQVSLLTLAAARYFALGEVPERLGTEHPGRVPSASFLCRDGKWLHITCSDQHWMTVCEILGLAEWGAQPGLLENAGRLARRNEVMAKLGDIISRWDRADLEHAFGAGGVPAGPINHLNEVLTDPQVLARNMLQSFEHPNVGSFQALPLPFKFDGYADPRLARPPLLGEHTDAVLSQRLGYTPETIAALRTDGVI